MVIETRQLWRRLSEPVDAASVVAFRISFGLLMIIAVARYFAHGWIVEYFLTPKYFFPHYAFEWVKPWRGAGMYVHFAVMGALAAFVAAGAFSRVSTVLFGSAFAYAHFIDKTIYLNHYYLVICLCVLVSLLPVSGMASFDAWRRPTRRSETVPAWALYALRAQVGLVYFFGGVAKLKSDWLLRAQPLKIWLAANTDVPILGRVLDQEWVAYATSYLGAFFDLSIVGFLLWRRSRPFAFVAVVAFHLVTARLFQLGMFPWIMIAGALLFFPPNWPRQVAAWLGRKPRLVASSTSPFATDALPGASHASLLTASLVGLWLVLQVLLPARQFAYPGNVYWTEQGFRFSWNVMLMEKSGTAEFRVVDPATGRRWTIEPGDYLTRYQTKMMSTQPDMILDFAHIVARDFRVRGVSAPEVYADVFASLNGRPNARLVDPNVDLAREHDGFAPKRWILPLESTDSTLATTFPTDQRP
jgi:vitamin K-dependent gamma-carboxylase